MNMAKLLVLGVDPGTRWAGLVTLSGSSALVDRARLDLQRMATDPGDPNSRILALQRAVEAWLARYQPGVLAVEDPAHPRNAHTAQLLGRAVWACVQPAMSMGLLVAEYRPGQVRRVLPEVQRQLGADAWSDDELAAAGAAWCALVDLGLADQEQRGPETRTRASGGGEACWRSASHWKGEARWSSASRSGGETQRASASRTTREAWG